MQERWLPQYHHSTHLFGLRKRWMDTKELTMDNCQLNQAVTPTIVAVSAVVSLFEQVLLLLFHYKVVYHPFVTPWTVAHQAPLSRRFPRQAYWSGLPFPPPRHPPDPGIKPRSPALAGSFFTIWATREVNTSLCIWYATIDLANEFFPILVNMVHQNQLAFSCLDQQYTSTLLYQQVYQFSGPRS